MEEVQELRVRGTMTTASRGGSLADVAAHDMAARLFVKGMKVEEIAEHLQRDVKTIRRWFWKAGLRSKIQELSTEAYARLDVELKKSAEATFERIQKVSDDALDKLLYLMEHADSQVVQMRTAQDLLDRNPDTSKTRKVEKTTRSVSISAEFLRLVETSEKEAGTTING